MAQPIDEHTLLLLHGEDLKDSSLYNVPITNNGVQVSTAQSKFGGKSLYFNGSGNIIFPQIPKLSNAVEFTIEWWENCEPMSGASQGSRYNNSKGQYGGILLGADQGHLYASTRINSWELTITPFTQTINKWVHYAVVKTVDKITVYRNGRLSTQSNLGKIWFPNTMQEIGSYGERPNYSFQGYIDEFRISDVVRWNSEFIPPTAPYGTPDFSYQTQVPFGSSKKVFARLYPQNPDKYFQTDLTNAVVELELKN